MKAREWKQSRGTKKEKCDTCGKETNAERYKDIKDLGGVIVAYLQ